MPTTPKRRATAEPAPILDEVDGSLLDIVDHVLTKGVVLTGDLVLGVADVDLVYLRLSAILCSADRVLGPAASGKRRRRHGLTAAAAMPGLRAGLKSGRKR